MKEVFKKVIDKLIIPEFSCIVDYKIIITKRSDFLTFIRIIYYTDGELKSSKIRRKIVEKTNTLYYMIGNINDIILGGVSVASIEDAEKYGKVLNH